MVFSDSIFLFFFFPIVITIYYFLHLCRCNYAVKNVFLLIMSLFFYSWGDISCLPIIVSSILFNYAAGRFLGIFKESILIKKSILFGTIIANLVVLFHYKYQFFVLSTIQNIFHTKWNIDKIILPIGISFFTFQAMSYVVDVYRGEVEAQKNIFALGLYISFFPQLVAGPIVRYQAIEYQINNRQENWTLFYKGMLRFIVGIGKKVLLANNMAIVADYVFQGTNGSMSVITYWIGAIGYTLQIYFDFSGYSDMAIGLGRMFGFKFEENFNYPYSAYCITDFWRKWHISLSSWFRDYVYIPLGGNRCSKRRHTCNLLVVWFLTGIWHGANWTFLVWGIMYFTLLLFEKNLIRPEDFKNKKVINSIYRLFTLVCIIVAWIVFRADSLNNAWNYIKSMFGMGGIRMIDTSAFVLIHEFGIFIMSAVILSLPIMQKINKFLSKKTYGWLIEWGGGLGILWISIIYIINGSYNPFIYFNF